MDGTTLDHHHPQHHVADAAAVIGSLGRDCQELLTRS